MINMLTAVAFFLGAAASPPRLPNACQLLTARDIARVQGQEFKSVKLTETESNGLTVSQCFYALPSFTDSVSVDLMRGKTAAFWRGHFSNAREAADDDDDHDRDRSAAMKSAPPSHEAEEEHHSAALKVKGIGDDAVWSGNRVAGALYVLKRGTIVRISVGGGGNQEQKIERSKKLAARALRKL
ncbi:MAG: hypothetical protein QOE68_1401 [Thermoanaerobaculia bacterium]|jgi:hypothetical protein|nr:hypothetical protein [Thermoanaerobaculia bacterium]